MYRYLCVVCLLFLSTACNKPAPVAPEPDVAEDLQNRLRNTIERLGLPRTNLPAMVRAHRETVKVVRSLTPEDLRRPIVLPDVYYPTEQDPSSLLVLISWTEDSPKLKSVIISNPTTGAEYHIELAATCQRDNQQTAEWAVLYSCSGRFPRDLLAGNPDAELVISTPDRTSSARLYRLRSD